MGKLTASSWEASSYEVSYSVNGVPTLGFPLAWGKVNIYGIPHTNCKWVRI